MIAELEAFPEIAGGHRRAHLDRFPYVLYDRIGGDRIDVVACLPLKGTRGVEIPRGAE